MAAVQNRYNKIRHDAPVIIAASPVVTGVSVRRTTGFRLIVRDIPFETMASFDETKRLSETIRLRAAAL
jgi:hypothetical protein